MTILKIGDKDLSNDYVDKKNSGNFKKAKIEKNTKIEIGDGK